LSAFIVCPPGTRSKIAERTRRGRQSRDENAGDETDENTNKYDGMGWATGVF